MDAAFFDQVRNAAEGFVGGVAGELHATSHGRGLKIWFGDTTREHYEAQFIRVDAAVKLEIGFHSEYADGQQNATVLDHLLTGEPAWRSELGDEAEAGGFLGRKGWIRISECWDPPESATVDMAIDIAARLADYIIVLEPVRRQRVGG